MLFPEDMSCFQPSMWGLAKAVSSRKPLLLEQVGIAANTESYLDCERTVCLL